MSNSKAEIKRDFLAHDCKNENYLQEISQIVSKYRNSVMKLNKEEKYIFRVGSLADTCYKDEPDILEDCEQLYLSKHMFMEVIGVLKNFSYNVDFTELLLIVCEDGKVYAYEDESLHLVAENLEKLFDSGVQFPGIKQYYSGEAFTDMTDKELDKIKNSTEVIEANLKKQKIVEDFVLKLNTIDHQELHKEQPGSSCAPVERDVAPPPMKRSKKSASGNCRMQSMQMQSIPILRKRKICC